MSDEQNTPRIRDPNSPATMFQRQKLRDLGCDPNAANDPRLTKGQASDWIDDFRQRADRATGRADREQPQGTASSTADNAAASTADGQRASTSGFVPADQLPRGPPAPAPIAPYEERDEERGPLTPVQVMTKEERESYGLGETDTVVLRGKESMKIVPEFGMPAKYLFARLSTNRRTNKMDVRIFPSIEGLTFRANAFADGIRKLRFEYVKPEEIANLDAFTEETKDPQIIARAFVTLGNGTEIVEEGTVRLSEIKMHPSRRDPRRMVPGSPVARSNPLELAKKRALARALRWGTGFGGTALDELPPAEQETRGPGEEKRGGPA